MRMSTRSSSPGTAFRRCVFGFFMCAFVLLASGRLGSVDALGQLQAATLLATTGELGTADSSDTLGWVQSPNGRWYEPHDAGALALMLPGAWLGAKTTYASNAQLFADPPPLAKAVTSLTYAMVGAIGCYFLFLLFAHYFRDRDAFLLAALFAFGSYFLPYAKVTWDVLPAAAAMCVFLYCLSGAMRHEARIGDFALAGLALALTCWFRYSLAPFMAVTLACLAWQDRARWTGYVALGVTFVIGTMPSFAYNFVRMGTPFKPATAAPEYLAGNNAMNGHIPDGLFGLVFSGNHGLIFYAPMLVLLLALPFVWRRIPQPQRRLIGATLIGSLFYLLLIARMTHWDAFGWGPRYLLPVLPIWFFAAAPVFIALKARFPRAAVVIAIAAFATNVAPATINWHVISSEYPHANTGDTQRPYALEGIWQGLSMGLHGKPLAFGKADSQPASENAARRFPDLWTARLAERSPMGKAAGYAIALLLIAGIAMTLRRICRGNARLIDPSDVDMALVKPAGRS